MQNPKKRKLVMTNLSINSIMLPIMKKLSAFTIILALSFCAFSQEALKSTEEEYYDFLSLMGITERPSLNYRTLSDSVWKIKDAENDFFEADGTENDGNPENTEETEAADKKQKAAEAAKAGKTAHPWQNNNLGTKKILWKQNSEKTNWFLKGINRSAALKIYGPEWFNSYNTAAPYGQNDGALWQGKGYNTSLTAGARLESYGFELTLKPQLSFSQNLGFDIMNSNYDSKYGYFWGYGHNIGADAPQRFGHSSFWAFDWGDSEIRWSWHTLTTGFGFQSPWLGSAYLNPVLHSNNAPSYPKFDIGLRRTKIHLPWLNWYIGDIEGRIWTGYLTESDYFDNDDNNNHNLIHGFTFSYSPSFLAGLTIGLNRTCLVKASKENLKYILPINKNTHVGEQGAGEDQKFSFTASYLFPKVGFEIYGEIGTDDYAPGGGINGYIRYFTHTMVYTVGAKKTMTLSERNNVFGMLIFEWNNTEMSQNYQLSGGYSFGFHYQITQGYTNRGQWLGSGTGYGGNSQYLEYKVIFPKGTASIFTGRNNPDNNFIYQKAINAETKDTFQKYTHAFKANYYLGATTDYFVTNNLCVSGGFIYNYIINPLYNIRDENNETVGNDQIFNFQIQLGLKYNI